MTFKEFLPIKLDWSMKSVSPQSQLGMSQQFQQRVQDREKLLKELQQAGHINLFRVAWLPKFSLLFSI
jgi:hypothetical protein